MTAAWGDVRDRLSDRADRIVADLREEWGTDSTVEPFELGPQNHHPDEPPDTVADQIELVAGISSVVLFDSLAREETVLVYNPGGYWEPPGGVIEADQTPAEAARTEAREETGLEVELTDLCYAGRFELLYENGAAAPLPVAQFVGHRVGGTLSVERDHIGHPGATRATGLFDADVLPDPCRDREEIERLLGIETA